MPTLASRAIVLAAAIAATSLRALSSDAAAQSIGGSIGGASRPPRIQLDTYSSPDGAIVADPMTEIIKISSPAGGWGTGTFLRNCRIYTALHVLLSVKHGVKTRLLRAGETLIHERFAFTTQPVPGLGRAVNGTFVVLAHGGYLEGPGPDVPGYVPNFVEYSFNDWAMGYDEECLSEKLKLGFVEISSGQTYGLMEGQEFFTAGHSAIDAAKIGDEYHLYVDSKCGVMNHPSNREQNDVLVSNCSIDGGGSGQLLLGTRRRDGKLVLGSNGRAQKYAFGMFQTNALVPNVGEAIPNVSEPHAIATFTNQFYARNIGPFRRASSPGEWVAAAAWGLRPRTLSHEWRWNVAVESRTLRMQYTAIALHDKSLRESRTFRMDLNALATNVTRSRFTWGESTELTLRCEAPSPGAAPPNCIQEMSDDTVVARTPTWSFVVDADVAHSTQTLLIRAIAAAKSPPKDWAPLTGGTFTETTGR